MSEPTGVSRWGYAIAVGLFVMCAVGNSNVFAQIGRAHV